jgi:UDPglucose 6-dehydrogenase
MAIAAHEWGLDVVAFDIDPGRVAAIRAGDFDPAEPGVVDFLAAPSDRFHVTGDMTALAECAVVMIAIDTVLGSDGGNDDHEVVALLRVISGAVPATTPIVVASQVRPGFSRTHRDLHPELYYFMETLIFGRGIERARFPERYIIGTPDPDAPLPAALAGFLALAHCPVHVMSYESAELTKLSANVVLSASITAANSLAELAEQVGADWRDIERALRDDSRIGQRSYISAGLGIGGANLARDLLGIEAMAHRHGADASFARTLLDHSDHMRDWTMRAITRQRQQQPIERLGILGLAYKPGTTSMRGGAGLALVEALELAVNLLAHDPQVRLSTRPVGSRARVAESAEQVLAECDVVAVTTPWPEYTDPLREIVGSGSGPVLVDPYRQVDRAWVRGYRTRVLQLGVGVQAGARNEQ